MGDLLGIPRAIDLEKNGPTSAGGRAIKQRLDIACQIAVVKEQVISEESVLLSRTSHSVRVSMHFVLAVRHDRKGEHTRESESESELP